VVDAGAFGAAAEGWVRISFTISDEQLTEGCRRIVEYVNNQEEPGGRADKK
jgi:aspartate/methionine/tyrosine aminotransferase